MPILISDLIPVRPASDLSVVVHPRRQTSAADSDSASAVVVEIVGEAAGSAVSPYRAHTRTAESYAAPRRIENLADTAPLSIPVSHLAPFDEPAAVTSVHAEFHYNHAVKAYESMATNDRPQKKLVCISV